MKRLSLIIMFSGGVCSTVLADGISEQQVQIPLTVSYFDPSIGIRPTTPKAPVQPSYVTYQDYTLFIWGEHAGYTLTLLDDSESVVYQTYIPAGTQTVSLPESLSGSYTLQLSNATYLFTGIVGLD